MNKAPERILRDRIKSELPADTFKPAAWRLIWFVPLLSMVVGSWLAITVLDLAWYWCLLLSVVIGNAYGALGFLTHEVSHGAMGVSKPVQRLICMVGFSPFLLTPGFWHRWHNVVHHGNTNMGDKDPDNFGTAKRYERNPGQKGLLKLAPGSGTWYSYLFLFYSFMLHSQAVLWIQTKHRKEFQSFNRRAAIAGSMTLLAFWIGLGIVMGAKGAFFGLFLPLLFGNFVIQSYILTNHFMRPQAPTNNPIDNSMSLNSSRLFDMMHFHFSHHVEHHLFPRMPSNKAPRLRKWFLENMPERYVYPSHATALKYLYSTPKVYLDAHTLVDVNDPFNTVDLHELNSIFNPGYRPEQPVAETQADARVPEAA